ncbi:MAG: hypothetical protein Q7P63_02455 [Verrucomicrobiota bacterium JB022]|nr:hypothetical protein [Verrucomicrobiota bacterium JB022]
MHKLTHTIRLLSLLAAACLPVGLLAEPVLVGGSAFAGQTLSVDEIKAVLMGKKVTIGNTRVIMLIAKESAAQDTYLTERLGMKTSQFQNLWRRLFMTGGGSAPMMVDDVAAVVQELNTTAGAVAIIDRAEAEELNVLQAK